MIIYFINKTKNTVVIKLNNYEFKVNSNESINIKSESKKMLFNCYFNYNSTFKHLPLLRSVITEYNFVLNSLYDITFNDEICEIVLSHKQAKGNNLELYNFIDIQLSNGYINDKKFFVQDELSAKQQLYEARQREIKLEKRLKIVDVLQTICYIAIPVLIILIGVWYFVDLKTALYILIPLSVVGVVIGLLLKKLINIFNNKLDKINSEYDKNSNEYIDTDLFFDKNYILDVIKNK